MRLISELAFIAAMVALLAVSAWDAVSYLMADRPVAAIEEGPGQTVNKDGKGDRMQN